MEALNKGVVVYSRSAIWYVPNMMLGMQQQTMIIRWLITTSKRLGRFTALADATVDLDPLQCVVVLA